MKRVLLWPLLASACAAPPPSSAEPQPVAAVDSQQPHPVADARREPSGYLTVEQAPASTPVPESPRPRGDQTIYAEIAGVSNEEAQKRLEEQEAVRPEFERLMRRLRGSERGNYTDAELIHRPDWAYRIYFKRQPEQTLRKYTRNPRFQARSARYTEDELRALTKTWVARFQEKRLFTGYGVNARQGRLDVDMIVSEEEYAAIAADNGWEKVPDYLLLKFEKAPSGPAVEKTVATGIRIFPQSDRNLGIHNQAGFSGRIVLRDGCFRVVGSTGIEHLAYFPREIGVYRDPEGFLALRTRSESARHLGRIGEQFSWAGPIEVKEDSPMVSELRAQCGAAPLMHVAIPESSAIFNARYGLPRNPPPPPPIVPQTGG